MTRARSLVAAALGLALTQTGCIPDDRFPVSVTVLGYEAPAARNGYVLVYDPYPYDKKVIPAVTKGPAEVLRRVDDLVVSCTNVKCVARPGRVVLETPPAGVDHVEIRVEKPGFEAQTISVPFQKGVPFATSLVMLTPRSAP